MSETKVIERMCCQLNVIDGVPHMVYTLKSGETLSDVALEFLGSSKAHDQLMLLNGLSSPSAQLGQTVKVRTLSRNEFEAFLSRLHVQLFADRHQTVEYFNGLAMGQLYAGYFNGQIYIDVKPPTVEVQEG